MANVWHTAGARVVTALMAAPALDGCGGTATGTSTATGSAASGSTATSPSWAMAVGPTAAVTHKDLSITPSRASFVLTRYTFTSQNKASLPHSRNVAGPGLDTVARAGHFSRAVRHAHGHLAERVLRAGVPGARPRGQEHELDHRGRLRDHVSALTRKPGRGRRSHP